MEADNFIVIFPTAKQTLLCALQMWRTIEQFNAGMLCVCVCVLVYVCGVDLCVYVYAT
jgi:hypothetical protein